MELIDAVKLLRSTGGLLLDHAGLTLELALLEWQAERARIRQILLALLCLLFLLALALAHLSVLALVAAWDTPYRLYVAGLLAALYVLGTLAAWRRLQLLAVESDAFAGSRQELRRTVELMRCRV